MTEFAICFSFLLILAVSIVDYGHFLETTNNLATVIRDGTRYASLQPGSTACGTTTATDCSTDTIQGVLQAEADSLSVPEGGLTLTNTNCTWSGLYPPPSLSSSPAAPDAPTSSCMTIAYYKSDSVGTSACAYYYVPTAALNSGSTCTAASASYVQINVSVASSDDDNPLTLTLNATFGLKLTIARSFVMAVEPGV
jgi:Flp pilus assembly protein TadG